MMEWGFSTGFFAVSSPEEILLVCGESGLFDLELWDHDGYFSSPNAPQETKAMFEEAGIRVRSLHAPFLPGSSCPPSLRAAYLARFDDSCSKARIFGAEYIVVHPLVVEGERADPAALETTAPESVRLWRRMAETARSAGLSLAFENIPRGAGWPDGCRWLSACAVASAAVYPNAGTCLDISHAFANGEWKELSTALETGVLPLGVHVSDGIHGRREDLHLPPGEGDFDWEAFLGLLSRRRFGGRFVIEVNSPYLNGNLLRGIRSFLCKNLEKGVNASGVKKESVNSKDFSSKEKTKVKE